MIAMSNRWFFANVAGLGDVAFRADVIPEAGPFDVRQITRIGTDGKGGVVIGQQPMYGVGLATDPVTIRREAVGLVCIAAKKLCDSCDEAWSTVKVAPASALSLLKGGA